MFCVCCVLPGSAALLSEARGSCYGEPRSPVPSGSPTRWLRAPCGSASEDGCNTHLGVSVAFLHRSCGHLRTDEEPFCFHFADGKGEGFERLSDLSRIMQKINGRKGDRAIPHKSAFNCPMGFLGKGMQVPKEAASRSVPPLFLSDYCCEQWRNAKCIIHLSYS